MMPFGLHSTTKVILAIFVLVLVGVGAYMLLQMPSASPAVVDSFETCVAAGNAVMESYPRQCRSAEGVLFVEVIDTPVAESWGTVFGTVLLGPTCPVVRDPPDPQCADKPYATTLALTTVDGARVIQSFTSDKTGAFRIDVPAGQYAIRSAAIANILPYCQSNGIFEVPINDSVEVLVSCDTGIR